MNEKESKGQTTVSIFRIIAIFFISMLLFMATPWFHAADTASESRQAMGSMNSAGFFRMKGQSEAKPEPAMERMLVPLGHTVGIKLFADGVMVVGISTIITECGQCSPAGDCGITKGDIITHINGEKVQSTETLQNMLQTIGEEPLTLRVLRTGKVMQLSATAVKTEGDGSYKLGLWIRDSMAGIGTLTFYDPESGVFGALGHGINDVDTLLLMPLSSGAIMHSTVKQVKRGESGDPGELRGEFNLHQDMGRLYANTDCGIFGTMEECELTAGRKAIPIASKSDVVVGKATILSNVEGDTVKEYEIEITKIYSNASATKRNMMIRVTDPQLLQKTGGIVQGMSGSPIVQNGRLVGAVTHVLVNDPTEGYAILIENMISEAFWQENENVS